MGTRSRDVEVKMLSDQNADSEGHSTDVVADAVFRFTLDNRIRRRGDPRVSNESRLLRSLTKSHGEVSERGVTLTGDRGIRRRPNIENVVRLDTVQCLLLRTNQLRLIHSLPNPVCAEAFTRQNVMQG